MNSAPNKIGKYVIADLVGRGGSGLVYKAFDPFVQREVAVKIGLQLSEEPRHLGGDSLNSNFFTEARAAGMLHHAHIVALYDAGMEDDLCYIVMEFIDGDTLLPWCQSSGPRMPVADVLELMGKCARGLDYSHSKNVLHRDIKPSNIMITRDGVPKIMDFSIAEINDRRQEDEATAVGSPLYMSPEQVSRLPLGPASDLYALGAVMYELFAGEPPFTAPHLHGLFAAIRNQPTPRLETKRPDVPQDICDIVTKLLSKKAADRYQSGKALAEALARQLERLRQNDLQAARRSQLDALRSLTFFNAFSEPEADELLAAAQLKSYAPGTLILGAGETDSAFFIIVRGQALVKKDEKPTQLLGKDDCFGEIGAASQIKRNSSVSAATQVVALKLSPSQLDKLPSESQLLFYKTFVQTLLQRLTGTRPAD